MKIGFIYTKFYPLTSSASVHGYQLIINLKKLGHEIYTIGVGANELTVDYPKSVIGLFNFLKSVDIVYIRINPWLINDWFTLAKLISLGRTKIIWEVNAPVEEILANYKVLPISVSKWISKQNLKRKILAKLCDATINVSEVLNQYSKNLLNIKNSHYIPNGSDPILFNSNYKDINNPLYEITKNKFVVVWAGNGAISWQGTSIIGEVAKEMFNKDKDIIFVYISNASIYNTIILPNIISLGEINYTKLPQFLVFCDIALCLYNNYDWCPYGFYNSSLKLFDFMSMGLPVIASNMGQISDVIDDGVDGFLTNNSVDDIVSKIFELKNNAALRNSMSQLAREKIVKNYNWVNVAKKTNEVIMSVSQSK